MRSAIDRYAARRAELRRLSQSPHVAPAVREAAKTALRGLSELEKKPKDRLRT